MFQDKKIGVLGGGQLGMMMIRAAIDYGLKVALMDSDPNASGVRYATEFTLADPLDYDAVMAFGRTVDVLTIEKEAVNVKALRALEEEGVKVHPSAHVVEVIQDKWTQKEALQAVGVPVVPGNPILNRADAYQYADKLPFCLKLRKDGYDGKGVMMLRTEADLSQAFDAPSMREELVTIDQEISVIVARNDDGMVRTYDPVAMIFNPEKFVLDYQLCPAILSEEQAVEANDLAIKIAETLGLVGILAIEMFITKDGQLLVNELAPRPHNSGHHTIEASITSQYEQHLRAILGLPLGHTTIHFPSAMVNILEPAAEEAAIMHAGIINILNLPDTHIHWYGKSGGREGRKMGHITILAPTVTAAQEQAANVRQLLKSNTSTI